jgi:choline-sulfatase
MSVAPSNLLILMSDQHNRSMAGCYGHPVVQTPNIDGLAARGVRFRNAYCNSPICVPSRASMATGRYAHQIGSWDNAFPYDGRVTSWGHRLTRLGHHVTTVGKLHYRSADDDTGFPDQRLPMHVVDGVGDLFSLIRDDMDVRQDLAEAILRPQIGESAYGRYDKAIADEACSVLLNEADRWAKPWVLYVSFTLPHHPLVAPREYAELYPPESVVFPQQYWRDDRPMHPALEEMRRVFGLDGEADELTVRRAVAMYYAMCTLMDFRCGEVLDALQASGLAESTRVMYTSDHGDSVGEHGLWMKHTMYEGSVGVPFILAGPGVPAGVVSDDVVSLIDCYPTILDCVGIPTSNEDAGIRGSSLFGVIAEPLRSERIAFGEYHAEGSQRGVFMIRGSRYKYVEYIDATPQLFDLSADPDELHDLAGTPPYAEVLEACAKELRTICDPVVVDRQARDAQRQKIDEHGGEAAIRRLGYQIPYTPAPLPEDVDR